MSKKISVIYLVICGVVLIATAAVSAVTAELGGFPQNANSSTSAPAEDVPSAQVDLSGTYTGNIKITGSHEMAGDGTITINGNQVTIEAAGRMVETNKALNESMRLWPPVWFLARRAIEPGQLGDHAVKDGQTIWISPYVLHRSARWWNDPERFDPQRFTAEAEALRPKHAFMPFGAGMRMCIGASFAWLEMRIVLATLMRRFDFALGPEARFAANPYVTLRPRDGMPMRISSRATLAQAHG